MTQDGAGLTGFAIGGHCGRKMHRHDRCARFGDPPMRRTIIASVRKHRGLMDDV